jgi:IMP dehydrogenase
MHKLIGEGLTFDDVLLLPAHSNIKPEDVNLETKLTKSINLNSPIMSPGMDTVTESKMAISLARQGGIGIIHKNMSIEDQFIEVDKVKRSEQGVITDPFFLTPNHYVFEADILMSKYRISGVPITENEKLVGIITNRDLRFEPDHNKKIYEVMTKTDLITSKEGTTIEDAKKILTMHKIEKLPIVDENYNLKGLITIKDIQKLVKYPNSTRDINGRLKVGASIGYKGDFLERAEEVIKAKVDVVVMEATHGHSEELSNAVKQIKKRFPDLQVIAGNVSTKEGAQALIDSGADALIVGIGAGSTSITSVVSGVGVPQITAIYNCYMAAKKYDIPIISNGGIKYSGDITKAISAGASVCMIGKILASCEESPSKSEVQHGRKYKTFRGNSSLSALKDEHDQNDKQIFIPEGIEGRVSYKGDANSVIYQLLGGVKIGMSYCGCKDINHLKEESKFIKITQNGLKESHFNEIKITKEIPNYPFDI